MKILGLDPATKFGWAVLDGEQIVGGGTWKLLWNKQPADEVLADLQWRLEQVKTRFGALDIYAFESARHMPINNAKWSIAVRSELIAAARLWGFKHDLEGLELDIEEIKRHATGHARAKKSMMVGAAERRWPKVTWTDDNHADAAWIADFGRATLRQQGRFHEGQNEGFLTGLIED